MIYPKTRTPKPRPKPGKRRRITSDPILAAEASRVAARDRARLERLEALAAEHEEMVRRRG